jgi:bifunctional DNA-binding transcriptional regulator/antitoxin component of YhaV-PrlF toxin-antitoxin module
MAAIAKPKNRLAQAVVQDDGSITVPLDVLTRAGIKPGDEVVFWTTGRGDINVVMVPKLTLDEMIERYGNKEIVELDWDKVREEAEEAAAQEVIAAMKRNA